VNESTITAESLGIIPYGQKKTPAERKLYTATSGGGIDGLLNTISGRKAMLKKNHCRKEIAALDRIDDLLKTSSILKLLRFLRLYEFQYYCIDDVAFANALRAKNKTLIQFFNSLAENYNEIIAGENK
jgi:chromosomal replication initiation ATPase DnaA